MAQFYSAKRRVTTRQIITVTVNDLDPFGQGVARHQGKALFVGGVLDAARDKCGFSGEINRQHIFFYM